MARETTCPVCQAYVPLNDDDRVGDYVYCSCCGAPLLIKKEAEDKKEVEVEEDWAMERQKKL